MSDSYIFSPEPDSYIFSPDSYKLKQITCDIICLCNSLDHFKGNKLNKELVELDRILIMMKEVKKNLIKKT